MGYSHLACQRSPKLWTVSSELCFGKNGPILKVTYTTLQLDKTRLPNHEFMFTKTGGLQDGAGLMERRQE